MQSQVPILHFTSHEDGGNSGALAWVTWYISSGTLPLEFKKRTRRRSGRILAAVEWNVEYSEWKMSGCSWLLILSCIFGPWLVFDLASPLDVDYSTLVVCMLPFAPIVPYRWGGSSRVGSRRYRGQVGDVLFGLMSSRCGSLGEGEGRAINVLFSFLIPWIL